MAVDCMEKYGVVLVRERVVIKGSGGILNCCAMVGERVVIMGDGGKDRRAVLQRKKGR